MCTFMPSAKVLVLTAMVTMTVLFGNGVSAKDSLKTTDAAPVSQGGGALGGANHDSDGLGLCVLGAAWALLAVALARIFPENSERACKRVAIPIVNAGATVYHFSVVENGR